MDTPNLRALLNRAAAGEDVDDILVDAAAADRVRHARRNLADTIHRFSDDMTGQDGESDIEAAADDYVAAQDNHLRVTNPDGYHELRQMGLL